MRSAAYSCTVFLVVFLLVVFIDKNDRVDISELPFVLLLELPVLVSVLIQDYLSLYKTRVLLKIIVDSKMKNWGLVLLIDLLTTFAISFIISLIYQYTDYLWTGGFLGERNPFANSFQGIGRFWNTYLHPDGGDWLLLTVYLGAFWIVFIQLAGVFAKFYSKILEYFKIVKASIDIKEKPIKSLGALSAILITICYIISLPAFLLIRK